MKSFPSGFINFAPDFTRRDGQPFQAEQPKSAPLPHAADAAALLARFNVQVLGDGKPPLIFCNGFGCSQHVWRYLTAALATRYQLVLFDYVGTGGADPTAYSPTKYASLHGYAQDVVAICRTLNLRDAVIIGHSVGATIAMLAAIAAPEHFARAVLLAASPCYLNAPGYHGGFDLTDIEQLLALFADDDHAWANPFSQLLLGPTNTGSAMEELTAFFCEMNPVVARQLARVTFLADNRADVSQLRLPTLVLQCSHDMAVPPEAAAYLLNHLPQGTLVQLQAPGHCPHLSAPTETLAALESFLA